MILVHLCYTIKSKEKLLNNNFDNNSNFSLSDFSSLLFSHIYIKVNQSAHKSGTHLKCSQFKLFSGLLVKDDFSRVYVM